MASSWILPFSAHCRPLTSKVATLKMSGYVNRRWDLPAGVLGQILNELPTRSIATSTCVAKAWKDAGESQPELTRKVKLEQGWRSANVSPRIYRFVEGNFDIVSAAKQGGTIALAGCDGLVLGDLNTGKALWQLDLDVVGEITPMHFFEDMLFCGTTQGYASGWRLSDGKNIFEKHVFYDYVSALGDLGDRIAIGGAGGHIEIWAKQPFSEVGYLDGHPEGIFALASAKDGKLLISGSYDESIKLWDMATKDCVATLDGNFSWFDLCDGVIATANSNGAIQLWTLENLECVCTLLGGEDTEYICYDGTRISTASKVGSVEVWDVSERKCIRIFESKDYFERDKIVGLFMDERTLTVVSWLGKVAMWDFLAGNK